MKNKVLKIKDKTGSMIGIHRFIFRDAITGKIKREKTYKNLIVNVCKNMIADRLAGGSDDTDITYGAVGTDNTTPAVGNTTLGTEHTRNLLASISASGAIVTASTFFGASEANTTIAEFGLFGNGATGSADSGTLINRVLIIETKTSSETLTIESTLTIS